MNIDIIEKNHHTVAVIRSDEQLITDLQSALDLLMTVKYEAGTKEFAINKEALCEDFFVLSTCLAGEILQKYINYGARLAIYGDFTGYTSKALHDFIYESNQGRDFYFQPDAEAAVTALCK